MDSTSASPAPSSSDVRDNADLHRFELQTNVGVAFVTYTRPDGIVTFLHEEVPPALRNHGIGTVLAQGALDLVRKEGFRVVLKCPFMIAYVREHPEYQDLLALPLPK